MEEKWVLSGVCKIMTVTFSEEEIIQVWSNFFRLYTTQGTNTLIVLTPKYLVPFLGVQFEKKIQHKVEVPNIWCQDKFNSVIVNK